METVGIFEAKAKLSEICEQVALRREPMIVTKRGKPLVRIVPIEVSHSGTILERLKSFQDLHGDCDAEVEPDFEVPERSREFSRFQFE